MQGTDTLEMTITVKRGAVLDGHFGAATDSSFTRTLEMS